MPVHDWTLVEPGIFHDFHTVWIGALRTSLNAGLLPEGYYALAEQRTGTYIADVLALHLPQTPGATATPVSGGTLVAETPPRARRKQVLEDSESSRQRLVAVRHVSGHRLVAVIEIVSPANKDRVESTTDFVAKAVARLDRGVHLLVVDLFPPTSRDPQGLHGALCRHLAPSAEDYDLPAAEPLTLASHAAGSAVEAYVEHVAVGANLPEMPLFLASDRYVNVPLETTYHAAYQGMPAFWRDVLEGRSPPS